MSHSKIETETEIEEIAAQPSHFLDRATVTADLIAARAAWPGRTDRILEQILTHETKLDEIWPGWRKKKPFNRVGYDLLSKIKWSLKKHALLTRMEGGQPAPLEHDVLIVRDGRNPRKCYAHPVEPVLEDRPDVTRNPFLPQPLAEVSR